MKRRLFWKILLAFWFTLFAITQGMWLLFELRSSSEPRRPPEQWLAAQVAPPLLSVLQETIARDGPGGFPRDLAQLPEDSRRRLELGTAGQAPPERTDNLSAAVTADVEAPDGERYRLYYRYDDAQRRSSRPLNVPTELLVLGLLGGLLFSAGLAWYVTEPIRRLRQGFERLAQGDLDTRLEASIGRRRDEIADLARDFDSMAARLEQLVAARDRLLHDVSHELRSPLARLQLAIALARQDPARLPSSLERIERELQRLEVMVSELLTLSRAESNLVASDEYFDPAGIVESVLTDARFEADAAGIQIRSVLSAALGEELPSIRGSSELIHRAVENVVRNALRFSSAGQQVAVDLTFERHAGAYRLEVSDQGPGVPEASLGTLFEPFVRGPIGRDGDGRGNEREDGFGLGLAIARRALLAHGGGIAATNNPGGGLTVTMVLPVTPVETI